MPTIHVSGQDITPGKTSAPDFSSGAHRNPVFRTPQNHFRTVWRILIYLGISILVFLPVALLFKLISLTGVFEGISGSEFNSPVNILFFAMIDVVLVIAAWITLRFVDKRPFKLLGFEFNWRSGKEFLLGCVIGFLNFLLVYLILVAFGWIDFTFNHLGVSVVKSMILFLFSYLFAAMIEELMNRGYILQALLEGTSPWIAVGLISTVFAVFHLPNDNMSWRSILFLFIHGILYASVYLQTRSLWPAIGLHSTWNFTQGPIFGMNVSGTELSDSLIATIPRGSELFTGGAFGAEGSIVASFISLVFIVVLWIFPLLIIPEDRRRLWSNYPHGFKTAPRNQK